MVYDHPKTLRSTSVTSNLWARVQTCLVYSYFHQQPENHLPNRSEQLCFQACRRYMWSGYLYKMSILWSNYWHWEDFVIRNKWVFFVCKQIAFWFIRDAPLRTNYSRCCLCFQWLKGPTWISYKRVTTAFNPVLPWTGILLARAATTLTEHNAWGSANQRHNLLLEVPLQASAAGGVCSCWHLVQGWSCSWLQQFPILHVTIKLNPPIAQIADLHYKTSQQDLPSKVVKEIAYSDDKNPCYNYPCNSKNHFPAMCTHTD